MPVGTPGTAGMLGTSLNVERVLRGYERPTLQRAGNCFVLTSLSLSCQASHDSDKTDIPLRDSSRDKALWLKAVASHNPKPRNLPACVRGWSLQGVPGRFARNGMPASTQSTPFIGFLRGSIATCTLQTLIPL